MTSPEETAALAPSKSTDWSSLKQRTVTGLAMVAVTVLVFWLGGWIFFIALTLAAWQINREWWAMRPQSGVRWRAAGLLYSLLPCVSLIWLRHLGLAEAIYPIALVIATDTGAYFAGKIIGGPRLAPRISPKKTWAGLLGGMAASIAVALLLQSHVSWPQGTLPILFVGASLAVLGQAGDLFESWLKRIHNLKDSGSLLPGHGGLMDRMDGYVLVLPVYLALVLCYAELLP